MQAAVWTDRGLVKQLGVWRAKPEVGLWGRWIVSCLLATVVGLCKRLIARIRMVSEHQRSGGAVISPPSRQSRLTPRSSPVSLAVPRLRA